MEAGGIIMIYILGSDVEQQYDATTAVKLAEWLDATFVNKDGDIHGTKQDVLIRYGMTVKPEIDGDFGATYNMGHNIMQSVDKRQMLMVFDIRDVPHPKRTK